MPMCALLRYLLLATEYWLMLISDSSLNERLSIHKEWEATMHLRDYCTVRLCIVGCRYRYLPTLPHALM